jgi:hypothetical protein
LVDELLQQQRIHPVNSQDDETVISAPLGCTVAEERKPSR